MVGEMAIALAKILLLPFLAAYRLRLFEYATVGHQLALLPGRLGIGVRRAWYEMTLEACGRGLVVEFLAAFRTPRARVGHRCYIGLGSWIGWAILGDDVITGNHITILSGRHQHGSRRLDVPMHDQPGEATLVRVGSDVWVGSGAIIAADVSRGTIVGAGAVVTKPFPEYAILAGVPAQQVGSRDSRAAEGQPTADGR